MKVLNGRGRRRTRRESKKEKDCTKVSTDRRGSNLLRTCGRWSRLALRHNGLRALKKSAGDGTCMGAGVRALQVLHHAVLFAQASQDPASCRQLPLYNRYLAAWSRVNGCPTHAPDQPSNPPFFYFIFLFFAFFFFLFQPSRQRTSDASSNALVMCAVVLGTYTYSGKHAKREKLHPY